MLNGFCPLRKNWTLPLFLTDKSLTKQAGWNLKQNYMKNTWLLVHCISSFEGTSYKKNTRYSCRFLYLLLSYISFYISRSYCFTSFKNPNFLEPNFLKKYFRNTFSFFNGFTQTPLSRDERFLSMLPKKFITS